MIVDKSRQLCRNVFDAKRYITVIFGKVRIIFQ